MGQGVVAGHVTLSVDEYNRLLEMAAKQPKRPEVPPIAYTIQSGALKLRVEGESVVGAVDLQGEVLAQRQIKAPLVTGMTVLDARQNGRPLPLVQEAGTHAAVLTGASEFAISLQVGLPLAIEPGRASFTLAAPAAGTVQLELAVPGEQTVVNVSPGLITERTSGGGKTTVHATLVPGKAATVWWASRLVIQPPAAPKEVRFLSDVKTLITVGEGDVAMSSLSSLTVVQGDPEQFVVEIPEGYEVTGATGATLLGSEGSGGRLTLRVNDPHARAHQFLISLTKPVIIGKAELSLPGFPNSQRETGEVLVEGIGTMELSAAERGGLRRMDVKEGSAQLRALAKNPVHAAFRYQKRASEAPGVAMQWMRFPDTPVISAVASRAVVTTLVTSEGRSLTEVKLTVRNREQAFVKVALPGGAQILSAEVAGEKVKPVMAADGDRVPLLRPGFRPTAEYAVSFVFLHEGTPFAKKGGSELALPKMDVPVGLVTWEVFLPKQYRVAEFGGDAIPERLLPVSAMEADLERDKDRIRGAYQDVGFFTGIAQLDTLTAGQIGGYVVDPTGAVVPRANVVATLETGATFRAMTDIGGRWMIAGIPSGRVKIRVDAAGFKSSVRDYDYDGSRPGHYSFRLDVGSVNESIMVTSGAVDMKKESQQIEKQARQNAAAADLAASVNVTALQNRVVGVLPIAVNVPRAGNSYRFVRPLVVDEETKVTFSYRQGK
jgi:hypothetical protein